MSVYVKMVSTTVNPEINQENCSALFNLGAANNSSFCWKEGQGFRSDNTFFLNSEENNLKVEVTAGGFGEQVVLGEGQIDISQYRQSQEPQDVQLVCFKDQEESCRVFFQVSKNIGQENGGWGPANNSGW